MCFVHNLNNGMFEKVSVPTSFETFEICSRIESAINLFCCDILLNFIIFSFTDQITKDSVLLHRNLTA